MSRIDIAGVQVDNITQAETLEKIREFVASGQPHLIVTTYSEFIVEASRNEQYKKVLNEAALSVPDGIGILWAAKFLSLPKKDPIITFFNWLGTLSSIVLAPKSLRSVIKEQVTGSRLVWDIARIAEENNYRIALVGGENGVTPKAAGELKKQFQKLQITMAIADEPFGQQMVQKISQSNSDILLIAYQPPKQEIWLAENLQNLNVKVAIGLGGTFDYLSGARAQAPAFMHYLGLEWFWRLVTQPWRIKRMWNAVAVFSCQVLLYKIKLK